MNVGAYIKEKQPFLYRTFSHAISSHSVSHTYLLSGEIGTPLKDIAIYMAKSLLCDNPSPLADEICKTCLRIDKGEYPDLIIIDPNEEKVSKDDISEAITSFNETPLETKGLMIYIINKVEALSPITSNALLKFLEEPGENTVVILTTENEEKILSTIRSRCQIIKLLTKPREEILKECEDLQLDPADIEMLSYFYSSPLYIEQESSEEPYQNAKKAIVCLGEALPQGKNFIRFTFENDLIPLLKETKSLKYFFEIMTVLVKNILLEKQTKQNNLPSYAKIMEGLDIALPNPQKALLTIMEYRSKADTNINPGLLLLHLSKLIFEE